MAPGAMDALSARLVESAGFPAVYMTGLGATASRLGTPDIGLLSQTEMTEHARNMARAVSIPIIADADTGYGGPSNIHRTVREHIQAGVAAIHLEDQVAPKRCGQLAGIRLIDAEEAAARLRCAIEARGRDDLIVIGRTDARPAAGAEEAIRRARLYRLAGGDRV
ncbi:MAG: oxaloacetate decarboxylase, partial [Hyphomicrobiaceae bacterium]